MKKSMMAFMTSLFISDPATAHQTSLLSAEHLGLLWTLPFLGMLISLAVFPLISKTFWENHYGKVAYFWSTVILVCLWHRFGWHLTYQSVGAMIVHDYLPFIIMMGALYTIAGGIQINIRSKGSPIANTGFLAFGTFLAGWVGTTGASMLLIRPFLRLNMGRPKRAYQMIFFIFLVSNVGGALTPLGDPPLFLGFLNGISFSWTLKHLALPMVMVALPLLIIFYIIDRIKYKNIPNIEKESHNFSIKGKKNILFLCILIGVVFISGCWKPSYDFHVFGRQLEAQNLLRDVALIILTVFSYKTTATDIHKKNHFSWAPYMEVIKLFLGIFVTLLPVSAILDAGMGGALCDLVSAVTVEGHPHNLMYFWLSGLLSSFLDNAPTYLVFFHIAGGEAQVLMSSLSQTLMAISLGSVFMGAMTYIGNAPNFMVKSVAESYGLKMPSFFGYMLWSGSILLPILAIVSWWTFSFL